MKSMLASAMASPAMSASASRRSNVRPKSCVAPMRFEIGQRIFRPGGARLPFELMKAFIDRYRDTFGVEPICFDFRSSAIAVTRSRFLNPP